MTTIGTTLSGQLVEGRAIRRASEFNRELIFAAAVYLAVAIVELSIIVLAAPSIGLLSVTVT